MSILENAPYYISSDTYLIYIMSSSDYYGGWNPWLEDNFGRQGVCNSGIPKFCN